MAMFDDVLCVNCHELVSLSIKPDYPREYTRFQRGLCPSCRGQIHGTGTPINRTMSEAEEREYHKMLREECKNG